MKDYYVSYKHYMVKFDSESREFTIFEEKSGAEARLSLLGLFEGEEKKIDFSEFSSCKASSVLDRSVHTLKIIFSSEKPDFPSPEIILFVDARGVTLKAVETDHYVFKAGGHILFGDEEAYAINTKDTSSDAIYAALGPATSKYDNAIYDRKTDTAFEILGCRNLSLDYDFSVKKYKYEISTVSEGVAEKIRFSVKSGLLTEKYCIDYAPMKLGRKYSSPPAGFMTWYSLKFDTCESTVLENAEFMKKHLAPYGANTVWIDWEWCHKRYERERFDGVDNFNPDKEKYPHGLGFMNEEIKKLGLTPALWIGFTNDVGYTDYEREHPEISLSHHDTWSGKYYYDFTSPEYIDGYLVRAVNQVKEWGYDVIKYDTLPNSITAHENYHENMKNPSLTTYTVFRNMVSKTRELLGEDCYMLSCGSAEEAILWGVGYFDAARIGPDLFTWEMYVETINRIRRYYALHTNAVYCDPDCVVLRDEYSTMAQARSRIVPVSLLGLPLNFGDNLTKLPNERIDLLKKALPTLNIHPTDFSTPSSNESSQLIVLKVAMPYEKYTVAALVNLAGSAVRRDIDISESLRLEDGKYICYDYFNDEYLGIVENGIYLEAEAYDTRLICIRKLTGKPQLLSTSRHFTQGAAEVGDVVWNENDCTLTITSELVSNSNYELTLYCPEEYRVKNCTVGYANPNNRIIKVNVCPPANGKYDFVLTFEKK